MRPARAIPYTLHADGHAAGGLLRIDFRSAGAATAVFQVRSAGDTQEPRTYTVEPGKQLTDTWDVGPEYDLSVYGPNGFFRAFTGRASGRQRARLDVTASYDERHNEIRLEIRNRDSQRADVTVHNGYLPGGTRLSLRPGETDTRPWSLARTHGWYDLTVTVQGDPHFRYRYAGHLENGEDSISDPAMGGLV